jgi:hypothetical protein
VVLIGALCVLPACLMMADGGVVIVCGRLTELDWSKKGKRVATDAPDFRSMLLACW